MSFDDFVHWTQSILGLLTSAVALIAGIPAAVKAWREMRVRPPADGSKEDAAERRRGCLWLLVALLLLLIAAAILGVWLFSPRVAITEPADAGSVDVVLHDNGSAEFRVHGTATRLNSNSGRRIYLLVHPDEPPAPGWWIQTPVSIDSEGRWIGVAWFGTRGWEAKTGQRLWLQAVVAARRDPLPAGSDGMPWVAAPEDLQPATASKVVRATVRGVTRR